MKGLLLWERNLVDLPNALAHKAIGVLGSVDGERRSCRQTFLQPDGLGVGAKLWTLIDIKDSN